ncbi:lysophospholipase L1-like esterase [Streptococcus loxodontisalivarius]|uniref:Lysophospholipase L1-like esterase n=1 Tax=Streptococcus loxodontisalivarius TaxID=1349415 RepID=A0ABS2PT23_9STRE|nr:SGNH/GDSL hydrolase family protein [Streptococcus loxodontisalivarius]MBM7643186.1 lysophospholipase L1-like esterase [Streptococcus loxodontisalivarius]
MIPKSTPKSSQSTEQSQAAQELNYLALGDSLTEGVGDSSQSGGFVPLLSSLLEEDGNYLVTSHNAGVSGNTSKQILKRMQTDEELESWLKSAQFMTLTVGGNDLLAVIKKNIADLSVDSFTKPAEAYQDRLRQIIELARIDNPDLPIYLVGIYNPFHQAFSEIAELQTIIDKWNQASQEVSQEYDKVYFVSIDQALYDGMDGQDDLTSDSSSSSDTEDNAVLYQEDHFHPNNTGYQIIANQVMEKINETKAEW